MATFTINANLGAYGVLGDFVNGSALHVTVSTATTLTLIDNEGDGFTFAGTGLTYSVAGVTGGTFTGLNVFNSTGGTLETATGFSMGAANLYQIFKFAGLEAAVLQLLSGNDLVVGSSLGDELVGGFGNDTIRGGGGADFIGGSTGRDKLFGGGGPDVFVFVAGDGKDHIMDFQDLGTASDDRISVTQQLFNLMTTVDTATGVELHFGNKGMITVDNWHMVNIDVTDFLLV